MITKLQGDFRAALRRATIRKHQVFLDIFAGEGGLGRALERLGFGVVSIDLNNGDEYDVLRRALERLLLGWISSGCVVGVHMAVDCRSWSIALHGPPVSSWRALRDRDNIFGFPDLTPAQHAKVRFGNDLCYVCCRLIESCRTYRVPIGLENPDRSFLWLVPRLVKLLKHAEVARTDFCQHGARWRKRTQLALWNFSPPLPPPLLSLCSGRKGVCSATAKPHVVLTGRDPKSKRLWSAIARPYPSLFCQRLASFYSDAIADLRYAQQHCLAIAKALVL